MVVRTKNAPHPRRKSVKRRQTYNNSIIHHKPIFIDREKNDLTPLGWVVLVLMCIAIISDFSWYIAPLMWLGVL